MHTQLKISDKKSHAHLAVMISNQADLEHPVLSGISRLLVAKLENKENEIVISYQKDITLYAVIANLDVEVHSYEKAELCRQAGGKLYKYAARNKADELLLMQSAGSFSQEQMLAATEGFCLAQYQFNKYKKESKIPTLKMLLINDKNVNQSHLDELQNLVQATVLVKNIINEPPIALNSVDLGNLVIEKAKEYGFAAEVLQKEKISTLKMGGLLGVNKGSTVPPTFSILEYKPENAKNKKPVVLIGKGVTFDTGGYSLKPANVMGSMKSDMSGAGAVLGTFIAVACNKIPVHIIGLLPSTDNRVNSDALVPDDVIIMSDNTSVEVQNTDAEGRLILADALHYAKKFNPELVIDLATLTGAAAAVTGQFGAALMGTDFTYRPILQQAGMDTYERVADFPFWKEYADLLKSDVADLKNIGGPVGGASTAGKFLEHFTDYPWLHLDIAGVAFLKEENGYKQKGGAAFGVRLLYHFLKSAF